ncbi:MAG: DUF3748 domain-containing protein [Vicinamibacterales bacterium]
MSRLSTLLGLTIGLASVSARAAAQERQITRAPHGHVLTNINVWSPDSRRIVYDTRTGDSFNGTRIEDVNVGTGVRRLLHECSNGANCGVVTHDPTSPRLVFIQGPERPDSSWSYGFTRRRGATVDTRYPGVAHPLDAMNYSAPFAVGALRGGSHVHVFSPDGQWVSFTYEDEVLARMDARSDAPRHEPNQRNVGVAVPAGPVRVARSHPRSHDGDWFSVVVTRTVAQPTPGSDEISRAFEEGWVGRNGYVTRDGTTHKRALAFLGTVATGAGKTHHEVFIADLPDGLTTVDAAPLAGTETTRPAPPFGVTQRRLTFTAERQFPGVVTAPRHWLRASPDGARIAFLMKDDSGVVQFWTVSTADGTCRQLTHNASDITSAFTWNPDGRWLAHTLDGSVGVTETATGEFRRLTPRQSGVGTPRPEAVVFSPDGRQIAYMRDVTVGQDTFSQIFVVPAR